MGQRVLSLYINPNAKQALEKWPMSNYFKGKCTPPGNAKLFEMGLLMYFRKDTQNGL
jgi:hypothetical protein